MADNSLLISIGVDNSSASKQLNAVKKELKSLDQQMALVNDSTGDYNKTAKGMTEVLSLQERKLEGVEAQLKLQQDILKKNNNTLTEKKKKLEELENAEEKNTKEIEKARKEVELYTSKVNQSQADIARTTAEMDKMNRVIEEQKGALAKVSFDKMSTSLKGVSDTTDVLANKLAPLAVTLGAMFTASIVTAMDFEESITQVGVTSQATADELATLKARAIELGEELPISSKDAADGFNYLALAGYNVSQQLDSIEPIAKASVAWNADLATVSDLTTDSLSALGLQVDDLGRYLDVASQAQSKSNTTATDLLTAYVGVGGTLKNLNIGLEESATWLGVLANRGVKGSEAGNALSAVLINLTSGAGQAGDALADLDISAFDSSGSFKGLEAVLKELDGALSKVTEEEKNTYLAMIGGKEHIGDLNALIDGLNNEYYDLSSSISNSNGRLDEMTDIMSKTSKMGIEELMGKLESLAIKVGDSLLPSFDAIVTGATDIVDNFANMDEGVQSSVVNFGLLTVASVPVLKIISSLTDGLSTVVGGFGKLSEAISTGQLVSSLTGLGSALGTVAVIGGAGVLTGGALYGLWKGFQSVYEVSEWTSKGVLSNSEYLRMIEEPAAQAKVALEQLTSEFETMYNKTGEILTNTIEINRALNEQQYQDTVNSYTKTHEGVIGTLEERRTAELEIIKGMYDDRILNAQLLSDAELQAVQAEKQAMVDATNSRIDEMVNIEKIGYERVMSDAKMAQDEMYAGNATFTQNMLAQREEYQNNVSVITETGNAYVQHLQEQNDASMLELTYQFKNDYTKNASDMYTQIAQLAETNRQSELAAEATSYQEKINKYGEYQDSYFSSLGTTKKEYLSNLKTQHEDANTIIENGYQSDITKLNNANAERQNVLALNAEAEYELITQNQKLTEDETDQYYSRVKELYDTGEIDNAKIIEDALEEILNNRKTNYSDLERTQSTHSTAYENETLNMWKDVARKTSTGTSDVMREMDRLKDKKVYVDTYFRTFGSAQASGSYNSAKSRTTYDTYSQQSLIPIEMSTYGLHPLSDNINNSLEIAEVSPFAVNSYDANATLNDSLSNYQRMIGNKSTDSMLETLKKQTSQQQKQIELLTQLALNSANGDSKIVIENLSVRNDNDIRMLAVELENLRKLEALSRGDI